MFSNSQAEAVSASGSRTKPAWELSHLEKFKCLLGTPLTDYPALSESLDECRLELSWRIARFMEIAITSRQPWAVKFIFRYMEERQLSLNAEEFIGLARLSLASKMTTLITLFGCYLLFSKMFASISDLDVDIYARYIFDVLVFVVSEGEEALLEAPEIIRALFPPLHSQSSWRQRFDDNGRALTRAIDRHCELSKVGCEKKTELIRTLLVKDIGCLWNTGATWGADQIKEVSRLARYLCLNNLGKEGAWSREKKWLAQAYNKEHLQSALGQLAYSLKVFNFNSQSPTETKRLIAKEISTLPLGPEAKLSCYDSILIWRMGVCEKIYACCGSSPSHYEPLLPTDLSY